jgi:hypothetical protein
MAIRPFCLVRDPILWVGNIDRPDSRGWVVTTLHENPFSLPSH